MKGDALDLLQQFANGGKRRTKRDRERALAAEVRALRALYEKSLNHNVWLEDELEKFKARVAELETQLHPPCSDPSIDAFYLEGDNTDFDVVYIDGKPTGKVVLE